MAASSDDRGNERAGGGDGEQEERTDGWMATYADMVTLLLTFFVLMFALSNVDNEKAELFLFAMSRDGLTREQFMEITARYDDLADLTGGEWDDHFPAPADGWDEVGDDGEDDDGDEGPSEGEIALQELANAIQNWIDGEGLGDEIGIRFNGDFLMLTLSSDIVFNPGRAIVLPEMRERAGVIAELLAANFTVADPFEIVVAGHTDNVPQHSAQFPSNWHLSAARAQNFLEIIIAESGIEPWHFTSRACGEYRPIRPNDTQEGRQANRRVEVMITRARDNPLWEDQFHND